MLALYHIRVMPTEPLLRWAKETNARGDTTQPLPSDLLFSKTPDGLRKQLADLITQLNAARRFALDLILLEKAVEHLSTFGIGWEEIDNYCRAMFPDMFYARYHVVEALILLSGNHIGISVAPNIVHAKLPRLVYDKDKLLDGDTRRVKFRKEGVLTGGYLLRYSDYLLDYNLALQGGFLELLSEFRRDSHLRVRAAINLHIVLDADYWSPICHRVYIRGPKAPSHERLSDPHFPRVATGEVTEHRRLNKDPMLERMLPLEATQVMWTRKVREKTVQIEELVPANSSRCNTTDRVLNRYVHSIWRMDQTAFTHVDGAIRAYSKDCYGLRLGSDLRNYPGKASAYRKLFRIDGPLDVGEWSDLVSMFFFGNELVVEYLEAM